MVEVSGEFNPKYAVYSRILSRIQEDPFSQLVWDSTVSLARREEEVNDIDNFYSKIPLEELVTIGEQLRSTRSRSTQYEILAQRSSIGIRWYDVILGHVNDKMFLSVDDRIKKLANGKGGKLGQALEVGTGTGNTIRTIAPFFEHVTGIDKQEAILQKEKDAGAYPENVDLVTADATKLPLQSNTIDVAVSNGLTYYLTKEQLEKFINEVARVLRPGGLYIQGMISKRDAESPLPIIEEEYLESAKGLLVCLLDNVVTHKDKPSDWNLRDMFMMFTSRGFEFDTSDPNKDGCWYMEFRKS